MLSPPAQPAGSAAEGLSSGRCACERGREPGGGRPVRGGGAAPSPARPAGTGGGGGGARDSPPRREASGAQRPARRVRGQVRGAHGAPRAAAALLKSDGGCGKGVGSDLRPAPAPARQGESPRGGSRRRIARLSQFISCLVASARGAAPPVATRFRGRLPLWRRAGRGCGAARSRRRGPAHVTRRCGERVP